MEEYYRNMRYDVPNKKSSLAVFPGESAWSEDPNEQRIFLVCESACHDRWESQLTVRGIGSGGYG
ncbi:hypothetical protein LTR86_003084, partial [Recurvomyces mirabilis]